MSEFMIDAILERDSIFVADLELSQLRLINNSDYPWVILVPRKPGIIEITDFVSEDYLIFMLEAQKIARIMQELFVPDKLNIAMIGNKVRQMHLHIIARYKQDKVFPETVWGQRFVSYESAKIERISSLILEKLSN